MDEKTIDQLLTTTFPGVETTTSYGYTFYFYGDDHLLPFATLISADTEHDRYSDLDREGVYRLNIGVSRATFQTLFGPDKVDPQDYDYTRLDTLMPHPEYAAQNFLCVLSPGEATAGRVRELLAEAYDMAVRRYKRRNPADAAGA